MLKFKFQVELLSPQYRFFFFLSVKSKRGEDGESVEIIANCNPIIIAVSKTVIEINDGPTPDS